MMIVTGIPFVIEVSSGINDESSHLPQCLPLAPSNSRYLIPPEPCQDFASDLKFILIYGGLFSVGLWLLIFGINEISIVSFSKKL